MQQPIFVYADLEVCAQFAGRLWTRTRGARDSATFEYDPAWLASPRRFSLEPALNVGPGPFHTSANQPLFGSIGDSAPDRWGRALMRRAERRRAAQQGRTPRTLRATDYLLGVADETRQGALRFALAAGGPFLATDEHGSIPPLVELPRLLAAADGVAGGTETDHDLRMLLAPGSSLGGARPKASVRDLDGNLAIAKFPDPGDEVDRVLWEAVALRLAGKAGIQVPAWRIVPVGGRPVLLLRRFDRTGATRIPFLSALSLLQAADGEARSYLEIADGLRRYGALAREDLRALWRRIAFSILISNTDDHLRNHGFLNAGRTGWRLSPAYDLNPVPTELGPRILSTAITLDDCAASLALALEVAAYFELGLDDAQQIVAEVGRSVSGWRSEAESLGLDPAEIDRMASAFEHEDLAKARSGRA